MSAVPHREDNRMKKSCVYVSVSTHELGGEVEICPFPNRRNGSNSPYAPFLLLLLLFLSAELFYEWTGMELAKSQTAV